ncbi:MAG TPA: hypothetical protein VEW48_17940 [Thermoanaerobaculia bacterium]|nr:hypothetical protein [Thermoanaerobaculia bacterium]
MTDDPDLPLAGRGALFGTHAEWDRFLCRLGSDGTTPRGAFVARNFILDEGVWPERVDSYRALHALAGHGDFSSWKARHGAYLKQRVQLVHWEEPIDPHDEDVCPETFRFPGRHTPFDATDRHLHLIRVERIDTVADLVRLDAPAILSMGTEVLANTASPERRAAFEDVLGKWFAAKDGRPVFCGFFADLEDEVFDPGRLDWADVLRDRLGLAHLDPGELGKPIAILVFKYPVQQVARLAGAAPQTRPLVPPTVLDGDFSEAFCPPPQGALTGHVVDLDWAAEEERQLRREILHPKTRLLARHLFRIGQIEKPVDFENLPLARAAHLERVRVASGRADYGLGTDKDLP